MIEPMEAPLRDVAAALRARRVSASELTEHALARHAALGEHLGAYKLVDPEGARASARAADEALSEGRDPGPLCGLPISVKDLYGVDGLPTYAGTARPLPERWTRDGWLVARLRAQGAVFVGKTHTVELAYGGVGINPHWGTPRNPWDNVEHRIPGGSSCGAGVSLWEGSALVALGSDTGGSIRIPASMTGTVGARTTRGRWPTDGVVPLSGTLDTVGALLRTVDDAAYFFGAVDPAWGDPAALVAELGRGAGRGFRVALPRCGIWDDTQSDVAAALHEALGELEPAGFTRVKVEGGLLDDAERLYMTGGIAGAECRAFVERDLPGWMEILHRTVGERLAPAPSLRDPLYAASMAEHERMKAEAATLFRNADVLALPSAMLTPPPITELEDFDRYVRVNATTLRPTCPVSILGLCSLSLPVGRDAAGLPVGLQLVAPGGEDELLWAVGLAVERALGTPRERLGTPPSVR